MGLETQTEPHPDQQQTATEELQYSGTEVYEVPPFKSGYEEAVKIILSQPLRIRGADGRLEEVYGLEAPLTDTTPKGLRGRIWRLMSSAAKIWGTERNTGKRRTLAANIAGALSTSKASKLGLSDTHK